MVHAVLDVHDVKAARVTVTGRNEANTAHVTAIGHHDLDASLEGDVRINGASLKVDLHGVIHLGRVSVKATGVEKTR